MTKSRFAAAVSFLSVATIARDSSRVIFAFARRKYAEIEYGYPMVVTPGVASALSSPFSFTTMPIISGRSSPAGRESFSFAITSSLSAICFTCFGETKLTASMCWNPASTNSFRYSALVPVGTKSVSPCQASLGHSMSLVGSGMDLALHSVVKDKRDERKHRGKTTNVESDQKVGANLKNGVALHFAV